MRWRVWGALVLSLSLGLGSLWLILPGTFGAGGWDVLRTLRWGYLGGALGTILAWWGVSGWRTALLARTVGARLTFWQGLQTHIIGVFSAAVTPTGGGNAVGIAWLLTRFGVSTERAVIMSVLLTVLDMAFFALGVPAAFLYLLAQGVRLPVDHFGLFVVPFSLAVLALAYGLVFRLRYLTAGLKRLLRLPFLKRVEAPLGGFLDGLELAGRSFAATPPPLLAGLYALTALSRVIFFALLNLSLAAVGLSFSQGAVFALQTIVHSFAFLMPTPGASGYHETAYSLLLKGGGDADVLGLGIVLWRFLTLYLYFLLGPPIGGLALFRPQPGPSPTPKDAL